jgi:hypothetical protein
MKILASFALIVSAIVGHAGAAEPLPVHLHKAKRATLKPGAIDIGALAQHHLGHAEARIMCKR